MLLIIDYCHRHHQSLSIFIKRLNKISISYFSIFSERIPITTYEKMRIKNDTEKLSSPLFACNATKEGIMVNLISFNFTNFNEMLKLK